MTKSRDWVIQWLLDGDPAIRWQVLRDLVGAADSTVERERRKVAREGWGGRLLAKQDREGTWGGGLYTPKWISTTYTMMLLRDLGLPANNRQARKACRLLLDGGFRRDGGINYGGRRQLQRLLGEGAGRDGLRGRSETCVTGMVLSLLSYFEYDDERLDRIADHLLEQQMADEGWNCERPQGASHGSFHTTISVLEGLRLYETHRRHRVRGVRAAQRRAREFLLQHRLYRSDHTGEVIKPVFLRFSFPPRWHYDILRGLDHFQAVDAARDRRLAEAIEVVRKKQRRDGRWPLQNRYAGKTFFEMEPVGEPSRWNTLRALRVLKWWEGG